MESEEYIDWKNRALKDEARLQKLEAKVKELKKLTHDKTVVLEQRTKIDTRTNILRASIGINTGLIAGLIVHFLTSC
jgi:hypothetical protein